ncbi:MAG: hypothetical protein V5A84_04355 [Planctomycetota bacterium]
MSAPRARSRTTNRGFLLTEALAGMCVLAVIFGGVIVALSVQAAAAARTLRRARCRLVLEGELEVMRGRPQSALAPREPERFSPTLGRPDGLQDVSFHRSVQSIEDGNLVRVRLWTTRQRAGASEKWVAVEGIIPTGEVSP